jgi:cytochrome P450
LEENTFEVFSDMKVFKYPPSPKHRSILGGHLFQFRRDPLGFLERNARDLGDIFYFRVGPQHAYFLNHPDYIKDVLVTNQAAFMKGRALQRSKRLLGEGLLTSEGDFHRRQRRLAQPAFHRQRIAGYGDVMVQYAESASSRWRDGETLDVSQEMMSLTLNIVAKTLFNADVEKDSKDVGEALTTILEMFNLLVIPFSEYLEKIPLLFPQVKRFEKSKARLDAIIYRIIDERRKSGEDTGDLLSMLILATDEEGDGGGMTNEQLRDEAMTIFLAGHETTANALTWTLYLLSQHPEIEVKLQEEIDSVLSDGRAPSVEDVQNLKYTEKVLAESMRLYPPAWAVGRLTLKDYEIAGYQIPKGALVLMSQYVMHRDPRYFPDPNKFDPERWTSEAREARPQFSYFPFGGGARRCIGEQFAWMEGILLLAAIAKSWKFRLVPEQKVEMQPLVTLRPKRGMKMIALKR